MYNKLLIRQLQKHFGKLDKVPSSYTAIFQAISESYNHYEKNRNMIERSIDLSSNEMLELNRKLKNEAVEVKKHTDNLRKINKELDQFSYVVSHDLKAPLRAIANLSEWIKEDLGDNLSEENKKNLDLLQSRVTRMQSLITGILEYSKIGRKQVASELVNVNDLLREILDFLSASPKFSTTIPPDLPTLKTQKVLLQQVFSNLVSNAIKYNDKEKGQIDIFYTEKEDCYEFSIADNGPGIAPEHHDKVFDIFQTLEAKDKVESTGIGLSIVKKIIEEQGGIIRIDSTKGSGAKFIFTWPKVSK